MGDKLKFFRRQVGVSQEQLAADSGISIRTIQRIEKGLSTGSGFTLSALAKALGIAPADLIQAHPVRKDLTLVKTLNLSCISVLLLPLSNIIFPALIFWKNRDNELINTYGRKILSFQFLWILSTLLLMVIIPSLMVFSVDSLRGSRMPLFVPVYFVCVMVNIYFTIRFAIDFNTDVKLIDRIPKVL